MKTTAILSLLLLLASCLQSPTPEAEKGATSNPGTTTGGTSTGGTSGGSSGGTSGGTTGGGTPIQTLTVARLRVKNFNQYNLSLEKLTGVSRRTQSTLFDTLIASLPADNEIEGMTPFNLIAMTRLADGYCKAFIERESTAGAPSPSLVNKLNPMSVTYTRNFLFSRFLDYPVIATDPELDPVDADDLVTYAALITQVDSILDRSAMVMDNGQPVVLFPNTPVSLDGGRALAGAACVAILASPYVTLLE